jgi:hypothetical protein
VAWIARWQEYLARGGPRLLRGGRAGGVRGGHLWQPVHGASGPHGVGPGQHGNDGQSAGAGPPGVPRHVAGVLHRVADGYGTTPDGRVFQTAWGGIIQDSGYSAVWAQARRAALTEAQYRSPLGRRPYDLRHAAVSLWLNSGVPATEVARRAGHGVAVLLKIYAHCIDGQADAANQRITDALGAEEAEPEPGGGEDSDSEQSS